MIRVTVWNEFHECMGKIWELEAYPEGMHKVIADFLAKDELITTRTATLDEPEHGLTDEVLNSTDVLIWWGHMSHHLVADDVVDKVHRRVLDGMGLIVLHSGHASKIFKRLMGTDTDRLRWHEDGNMERVWIVDAAHQIAEGLPDHFDIDADETYGEHFDIPRPDELVFVTWFPTGEIIRSGCCWHRGLGRVFYFQPGHETNPVFNNPNVQIALTNAVKWAYRKVKGEYETGHTKAL